MTVWPESGGRSVRAGSSSPVVAGRSFEEKALVGHRYVQEEVLVGPCIGFGILPPMSLSVRCRPHATRGASARTARAPSSRGSLDPLSESRGRRRWRFVRLPPSARQPPQLKPTSSVPWPKVSRLPRPGADSNTFLCPVLDSAAVLTFWIASPNAEKLLPSPYVPRGPLYVAPASSPAVVRASSPAPNHTRTSKQNGRSPSKARCFALWVGQHNPHLATSNPPLISKEMSPCSIQSAMFRALGGTAQSPPATSNPPLAPKKWPGFFAGPSHLRTPYLG